MVNNKQLYMIVYQVKLHSMHDYTVWYTHDACVYFELEIFKVSNSQTSPAMQPKWEYKNHMNKTPKSL
jgi:hypothetical protein